MTSKRPSAHPKKSTNPPAALPAIEASDETEPKTGSSRSAAALAEQLLKEPDVVQRVAAYGAAMVDVRPAQAAEAARILSEVVTRKPELLTPLLDKMVSGLLSEHKRVVQTAAEALPVLVKVAPAKVAKYLDALSDSFPKASDVAKDGIIKAFVALCIASVAYQKRLEPVLVTALSEAEGKVLLAWSEIVLPSLKGEPHARVRAVVEQRLYQIDRAIAQRIAVLLGIRLRPASR